MIVAYIDHTPVLLSYLLVSASAEANKRPAKLYIKDNLVKDYRIEVVGLIIFLCDASLQSPQIIILYLYPSKMVRPASSWSIYSYTQKHFIVMENVC